MISSNAAALFQIDPFKALAKSQLVAKMALENDIMMLQETHADQFDLHDRCPQVSESHWCTASQGPIRATGGVLTLISKKWLGDRIPLSSTIAEGRVFRTEIRSDTSSLVIYNIHNFDLELQQMKEIEHLVKRDTAEVNSDPTRRSVILAGDWNFCPDDEPGLDLKNAPDNFAAIS